MSKKQKRLLFLCAQRSVRALMAASLLATRTYEPWDIWSTPVSDDAQEQELARRVFDEMGIALLTSPRISEPSFGLTWDEGVILCSGLTDT